MTIVSGLVEPYKSRMSNIMDLINETFVFLTIYTLICFTDFVVEKSIQTMVGKGLIFVVILSICTDLAVILVQNTSLLARNLKIGWLKLKQKWALEERT